jgi:hypothetical protein
MLQNLLSERALQNSGLFNPLAVTQLVRKAQSGMPLGEVDDMAIAGVLSAQLTHQIFIQGFDARPSRLTTTDRVKVVHGHVNEELVI